MSLQKSIHSPVQTDIFSMAYSDVLMRDVRETIEVPFFSLSRRPQFEPIEYERHGIEVRVTSSHPLGIATIWDWDLMMWLVSQIRYTLDLGLPVSRRIRFSRIAFLRDVRRNVSMGEHKRLKATIERLRTTQVRTSIRAPRGKLSIDFNWLEHAETESDGDDVFQETWVVIPEWLFDAVIDKGQVLTLPRNYFLLNGGLERWFYRFIRRQAGINKSGWRWKMNTLYERSGSPCAYRYFARDLRQIIDKKHLLDYELSGEDIGSESYVSARRIQPKNH